MSFTSNPIGDNLMNEASLVGTPFSVVQGKSIDVPLLGRHADINIVALVCASFSGVRSDPYAALSERASTVSVGAENCLGIVPIIAIG